MSTEIKLKGLDGWNCFTAYLSVLYFLSRAKTIRDLDFDTQEECLAYFKSQVPEMRKKILIELIALGCVNGQNMMALVKVHSNKQGIYVDAHSVGNYDVVKLSEMCLASLMACSEVSGGFF